MGKVRHLLRGQNSEGSARAHDTAFYLCRPFCGTTERHLVFTATPQATSSNPPSHPHADANPPPFHPPNPSLPRSSPRFASTLLSRCTGNQRFVLFRPDYVSNANRRHCSRLTREFYKFTLLKGRRDEGLVCNSRDFGTDVNKIIFWNIIR